MKTIFDILTDPLGLPINPLYEWIIMILVGEIAYRIAFAAVGDLGVRGTEAFAAHWVIRFLVYGIIWAVIRTVIWTIRHWQIVLMAVGSIVGTVLICVLTVVVMRLVKKHRTVNNNA